MASSTASGWYGGHGSAWRLILLPLVRPRLPGALSWVISSRLAACGRQLLLGQVKPVVRVEELLLELDDPALQSIDVLWRAEAGLAPGLLAEHFGQSRLKLADSGGEPAVAFMCVDEIGLQ